MQYRTASTRTRTAPPMYPVPTTHRTATDTLEVLGRACLLGFCCCRTGLKYTGEDTDYGLWVFEAKVSAQRRVYGRVYFILQSRRDEQACLDGQVSLFNLIPAQKSKSPHWDPVKRTRTTRTGRYGQARPRHHFINPRININIVHF